MHSPLLHSPLSATVNKQTYILNSMLRFFNSVAVKNGIRYSITYGTYLGWLRKNVYISWDSDVDVHVGQSDANALLKHPSLIHLGPGVKVPLAVGKNYLIAMNDPAGKMGSRSRYTCAGILARSMTDKCAFNGPFARVVQQTPHNGVKHVDIYLFLHAAETLLQKLARAKHVARIHGNVPVYVQHGYGSELPPLRNCQISGLKTLCFTENYGIGFMQSTYGADFLKPLQ